MVSLCQICGVVGYKELLVYCKECKTNAQHRYCFDKLAPRDQKIRWFCEECKSRSSRTVSFEKPLDGPENSNDDLQHTQLRLDQNQKISSHGETIVSQNLQTGVPQNLQTGVPSVSQPENIEGDNRPCTSSEQGEKRPSKRRRRLILPEEDSLDQEYQSDRGDKNVTNEATDLPTKPPPSSLQPLQHTGCYVEVTIGSQIVAVDDHDAQSNIWNVAARPILNHVWRGVFSFGDEEYGPLIAHLSTMACEKVFDAVKLLPPVLCMEKLSRLDAWPNSFKNAPPTDVNIGLYFLSECLRDDTVFDGLVGDAINEDLVFKFILDEAELLVFSSIVLPEDHHRFQSKNYLWGLFRRRQVPALTFIATSNCGSQPSDLKMQVSKMLHSTDKGERDGGIHDDSFSFQSSPGTSSPKASDVIQNSPDISSSKANESRYSSKHAQQIENEDELSSKIHKTNQIQGSELKTRKGNQSGAEPFCSQRSPGTSRKASEFIQSRPHISSSKANDSDSEYLSKQSRQIENELNPETDKLSSEIQNTNQIQGSELKERKSKQSEVESFSFQSSPGTSPKASDVIQNIPEISSLKAYESEYLSKCSRQIENELNAEPDELFSKIQKMDRIQDELKTKKRNQSEAELEEGEIVDECVEREEGEVCAEDYEDGHCLQLFPLGVEDMGIVARFGGGAEVNLELGLR